VTSPRTCSVTATKAANGIYNSTTANANFTFVGVSQSTLSISNASKTGLPAGTGVTLTIAGGSGAGASTFTTSTAGCSISTNVLNVTSPRTCSVTATKAANGIYNSTTANANFTFISVPQAVLKITNTKRTNVRNSQITITTSGGSGTGSVDFSVTGSGCRIVNRTKVTSSNTSRCLVTAYKGASGKYGLVRSTPPTEFRFTTN
jgi:hypothetical protein